MAKRKRLQGGARTSWLGRPVPLRVEPLEDRTAPAVTVDLTGPAASPWSFLGPVTVDTGTPVGGTETLNGAGRRGDTLTGPLTGLTVSPANFGVGYAVGPGGVWRTDTLLAPNPRWSATATGALPTAGFGPLAADPTDPNTVYATTATAPGGTGWLYLSRDAGQSWQVARTADGTAVVGGV